jgi:hypothetical protein
MRICLGLLGFLHGLAAAIWLCMTGFDSAAVGCFAVLLLGDSISIWLSIANPERTGFLLVGAAVNVMAVVVFCVIPFMKQDQEYAEGLGMLVAGGIVIPLLGPLLVNAFVLVGMDFVQRSERAA